MQEDIKGYQLPMSPSDGKAIVYSTGTIHRPYHGQVSAEGKGSADILRSLFI